VNWGFAESEIYFDDDIRADVASDRGVRRGAGVGERLSRAPESERDAAVPGEEPAP